jgi:hypothetical protein
MTHSVRPAKSAQRFGIFHQNHFDLQNQEEGSCLFFFLMLVTAANDWFVGIAEGKEVPTGHEYIFWSVRLQKS